MKHVLVAAVTASPRFTEFPFCRQEANNIPCHCPSPSSVPLVLLSVRGGELKPSDDSKKGKSRRKRSKSKNASTKDNAHQNATSIPNETNESTNDGVKSEKGRDKSNHSSKAESNVPPIMEEILKEEEYYKILGLTKQEALNDPSRIAKAYRRRCLMTHPDKTNGDRRAFDKVAKAYEVLGNDEKRATYNRFGKEGVKRSSTGAGFSSPDDLFRSFFGGRGFNAHSQQPRRNRTVRYQLEVTLEDLYRGITRDISIASPAYGPQRTKTVQVHIPRGAVHGQYVTLSGEMDFDANETPGDLIFLLSQRPHMTFTRKGNDLAIVIKCSLQEAINGVTRRIYHLDGKELVIGSARNESGEPIIIRNNDVQVLKGKGMPKDELGLEFGDMYVQYEIQMPDLQEKLTSDERKELSRLLNKLEGKRTLRPQSPKNIEYLTSSRVSDFGRASGKPRAIQEDHEDDNFEGFSPFGAQRFQFSSTYSNPFFGSRQGKFDEDDPNVECRQM